MKKIMMYYILFLIGCVTIITGIITMLLYPEREGMMLTLPYIFLGIGCGFLGGSFAMIYGLRNPVTATAMEIAENDEREQLIRYKAKAKAGDITLIAIVSASLILTAIRVEYYVTMVLLLLMFISIAANLVFSAVYRKEL
ncbi:MAG: hypothetical protein WCR24_05780 [Candidatus Methanomethylophilaceae archaeon]